MIAFVTPKIKHIQFGIKAEENLKSKKLIKENIIHNGIKLYGQL